MTAKGLVLTASSESFRIFLLVGSEVHLDDKIQTPFPFLDRSLVGCGNSCSRSETSDTHLRLGCGHVGLIKLYIAKMKIPLDQDHFDGDLNWF